MATTAALRPALLAPSSEAASALDALPLARDSALSRLKDAVLETGNGRLTLSPAILRGVSEHAAWTATTEDFRRDCADWLAQARQASIIYAPSTDVWRKWLRGDGPLGALMDAVVGGDANKGRVAEACRRGMADSEPFRRCCSAHGQDDSWSARGLYDPLRPELGRRTEKARGRTARQNRPVVGTVGCGAASRAWVRPTTNREMPACRHAAAASGSCRNRHSSGRQFLSLCRGGLQSGRILARRSWRGLRSDSARDGPTVGHGGIGSRTPVRGRSHCRFGSRAARRPDRPSSAFGRVHRHKRIT